MLLSFELTMPNIGSWNGKWSSSDKKFFVIKNVSNRFFNKQEYFNELKSKGNDNWYYNFGDGWGANVKVEMINSDEAKIRRKNSKGFAGYNWMVNSIILFGNIDLKHSIS